MSRKINRQDLIVSEAAELFITQGYNATSVRQIAEAAGCTDAALYYHFREGKRALFQAVLERNLPDFLAMLEPCQEAVSLPDLISTIGKNLELATPLWGKISWLVAEFPHLSDDEKKLVHQSYLTFQSELMHLIRSFVEEEADAQITAWLVICALFGYGQTFLHLEMQAIVPLSFEQFKVNLAQLYA